MTEGLIDPFGRRVDYLRLSLTDKCNMRCFYCIPKGFKNFRTPDEWLSFNEIQRIVRIFSEMGVSHFRLTGGEPLVRRGITDLVSQLSSIDGVDDLSLSTNASLLEHHALDLKVAGISRINVSLDSLQEKRFRDITGTELKPVLKGLMAAKSAGFNPVKINMLALKRLNDDEFDRMVEFCIEHDFTLRFIETMPMGSTGKAAGKYYMPLTEVRHWLEQRFELLPAMMPGGGPAHYVQVSGTDLRIGFISPISQHFCETCNRIRLSVDGTLYLCLGQSDRYELRPLLRRGISDDGLVNAISEALALKPQQHDFVSQPGKEVRIMSLTGG